MENERSSLNLQIQVLSDKLDQQRDTIHEYEQIQQRNKFKYHQTKINPSTYYHPHVHQPVTYVHRVCICVCLLFISLDSSEYTQKKRENEVMLLRRSVDAHTI